MQYVTYCTEVGSSEVTCTLTSVIMEFTFGILWKEI